ncbi:MAG TPA: DUF1559 domain-containing protein, partial [Gemmataceae bacterium]|nr:DUF1559 domain-containing protein [Gemmataceae bacterium]
LCPADTPPAAIQVGPRSASGQLLSLTCTVAPASYAGNYGVSEPGVDGEGVFFRNSQVKIADITDGTSQTLLAGERSYRYAETVWAGAVTGARTAPPPDSPLSFEMDDSSNLILSHVGEMVGGAGRPRAAETRSAPPG